MKRIADINNLAPMLIAGYVTTISNDKTHVKLAEESGNENMRRVSMPVKGASISLKPEETEAFLNAIFDTPLENQFESNLQSLFSNDKGDWLSTSMLVDEAQMFLDGVLNPSAYPHEIELATKLKMRINDWFSEHGITEVLFSGLERNPLAPRVSGLYE